MSSQAGQFLESSFRCTDLQNPQNLSSPSGTVRICLVFQTLASLDLHFLLRGPLTPEGFQKGCCNAAGVSEEVSEGSLKGLKGFRRGFRRGPRLTPYYKALHRPFRDPCRDLFRDPCCNPSGSGVL